jgi:microcystin-dependent protein
MDPYVGEIRCFGFNFAPRDWAFCNGQLLPITQFTPLFAILGTTYGGNGTTTFALPNLQGRSPMHWGSSPGFNTDVGEVLGQTEVTLITPEIPQHIHTIIATSLQQGVTTESSAGPNTNGASYLSRASGSLIYQPPPATPTSDFADNTIAQAGGSLPHENQQPFLTLNFCISLNGQFPSRN